MQSGKFSLALFFLFSFFFPLFVGREVVSLEKSHLQSFLVVGREAGASLGMG